MAQLKAAAKRSVTKPPLPPALSPQQYLEFATFAARFNRAVKPVRFTGDHWKL